MKRSQSLPPRGSWERGRLLVKVKKMPPGRGGCLGGFAELAELGCFGYMVTHSQVLAGLSTPVLKILADEKRPEKKR